MKGDKNQADRKILKNLKKREKPARVGWGPTSAILVTLGIYFGAQLFAGYFIVQYLISTGSAKENISSLVEESVPVQFGFILLVEIFSLLLLWLFLKRRKISWEKIGLKKPSIQNLLYAFPAYAGYFLAVLATFLLIENFFPAIDVRQEQQVGFDTAAGSALILVFVALVILPALVEEIIVRGFLYGGLRNKLKPLTAALVASVVFGAAHLQLGSGEKLVWIAAIDTFVLSMVLIWLREKTGNIWAGVVVHMIKNSLAFVTLFIVKTS